MLSPGKSVLDGEIAVSLVAVEEAVQILMARFPNDL